MENIDCRTCQHSRMDLFRGIRYCTKSGDYCHGSVDSDGTNMSAERYNSFEPDSGYCPGCEMVRALRQSEDSNS